MENIWVILGIVLMIAGIAGSVIPLLPGPPLCYIALLIQQFRPEKPFSLSFLLVWGLVVALVVVLDYLVPIYGTKKFGGTKNGVWGSAIGLVAGFWMGPLGIVLGPLLGAFIGEYLANNDPKVATRAALGSFAGFAFGTVVKLVACLIMAYHLAVSVWPSVSSAAGA